MAFTDDFDRANENVEADANWTRVDGATGAAQIISNVVHQLAGSNTAYHCPDQGSADHYTQCAHLYESAINGFSCTRLTDSNNFIGARHNGTDWQLYKRVALSFTLLDSYTAAFSSGDVVKLVSDGNDHEVFINTVSRMTEIGEAFNNTETRQGFVARDIGSAWLDDFEAGVVSAGGVTGKANPLYGPFGGPLYGTIG